MTRSVSAIVMVVLVALLAGCGLQTGAIQPKSADESDDGEVRQYPNSDFPPSLVQMLAHPDRYHGEKVQIKGYLHVRFEGTAIYLSRADAEYGITYNGF